MAFTQTDLDNINTAIAAGELTVRASNGSMVTYRSMDELLRARGVIQAELTAASSAGGTRRNSYRFTFTTARGH
jgi:hypothetical protein